MAQTSYAEAVLGSGSLENTEGTTLVIKVLLEQPMRARRSGK